MTPKVEPVAPRWRRLLASMVRLLLVALAAVPLSVAAQPADCPEPRAAEGQRQLAVISDLHMGAGREADGRWDPTEDFRWPGALQGLLERLSSCGRDAVDLVIAGDLLELWQPPGALACRGATPELGCTPPELTAITKATLAAHDAELKALGRFAARGSNRVVVLPGNHDAALVLDAPWRRLLRAMAAPPGRVQRVDDGLTTWADGRVLIEHGHQIGGDANRYADWPSITRRHGGATYVVRPWGERFVQRLFNKQERVYPVIDNLSPESMGARYRMLDRGLWRSAGDVARFLAFNVFGTSVAQKLQFLGDTADDGEPRPWDLKIGRRHGHRLFAAALPDGDPLHGVLVDDPAPEAAAVRAELDALAADPARLPDAQVNTLCDQAAANEGAGIRCEPDTLGAMTEKLLIPRRWVLAEHLRTRLAQPGIGAMQVFIYGHTHELEPPWSVAATDLRSVTVLNAGGFVRVVDNDGFLARARLRGLSAADALRRLEPEDLAPCYTVVLAAAGESLQADTLRWHQPEGLAGRFTTVSDEACR